MRSFFTSRLFIAFCIILFFISAFFLFLPSIISSSWGKKQIVSLINNKIPGKVEIKDLELHWNGNQVIEGFVLKDQNNNVVLEFEKLFVEATLFQILNKSTRLGEIRLQDLNASIISDEKGVSNLQHALGIEQESYYGPIPNGAIDLSNFNAKINFYSKKQPLSINISGLTHQNRLNGSLELHAILPGLEIEDWSQLNDEAKKFFSINGSKEATLEAKIQQFPVDLIDQLLALKRPELGGLFRHALGEKININLDKESSSEGLAFNLTFLSPRLQGNVKGKILNDKILLQEPSTFNFDVSPDLINPLLKDFQLAKKCRFKLVLDEFTFPISFTEKAYEINPCSFGIKMQGSSLENPILIIPQLGTINVDGLKINIDSPLCTPKIDFKAAVDGSYNGEKFNINSSATFIKPKEFPVNIKKILINSEATILLTHFPLSFLNSLKGENVKIAKELIGSFVNLQLHGKGTQENTYDASLSLESEKLAIKNVLFQVKNEAVTLSQPAKIDYRIDPESINPLLKQKNLYLEAPVESNLIISNAKFSFASKSANEIQIQLNTTPLKFLIAGVDRIEIGNLQMNVEGKSLNDLISKVSLNFKIPKTSSLSYLALIGDKGNLSISANIKTAKNNEISLENIKTYVESNKGSLSFKAEVLPDAHFILTSPIQMHYKLDSQVFETFVDNSSKLTNNPFIHLNAEPFQINLKDFRFDTFTVKGNISSDTILLQNKFESLIKIENVSIPWEINVPLNMIRVNFKALASTDLYPIKPSEINTQLLIFHIFKDGKFNFSDSQLEATSNLIGFPTSLISSLMLKEDLTPLFGPILDVELKTNIDPNATKPGFCNIILDSTHLHFSARLTFDKFLKLTDPSKPAEFRWTLTPEAFDYLQKLQGKDDPNLLDSSVTLKGTVSNISFPLSKDTDFFKGGQFKCNFETTNFVWEDAKVPAIKFNGNIQTADMSKGVNFEFNGITNSSKLNFQGQLSHFLEIGKKGFQAVNLAFNLAGEQFPVEFFQPPYLPDPDFYKKLSLLFGKKIDFSISADLKAMEGPLKGTIKGSEGQLSLDGQLKQGTLYLNAPFEWTFKLTSDFGKTFFKEGPLTSVINSSHPIKLVIQPKGFAFPLQPFDLKNLQLGKGSLALNQVLFKNEGEINKIVSLIKSIPDDKVSIWFTPIYFQIKNGDLELQRIDMLLAQSYEMALWGHVDLVSTKLNMKLGLSNQTLANAFNIPFLTNNYMLVIPIKGKQGNIEIDKKQALASIASLVAQAHGSSEGKILGGILEFTNALTNNEPIPEPTTQPFPWAKDIKEPTKEKVNPSPNTNQQKVEDNSNSKKSKSKKESSNNFLQELEKGASTILDLINNS